MPTYVFRCPEGHEIELVLKIAERDATPLCPECSGESSQIIAPLMARVPAAGTGPAAFPGAASWRDRYR